jgi:NADH dehydrogenase FAD-containing subunit
METGSLSAMIDSWSKIELDTKVTKLEPEHNRVTLSNGKVWTYKTLVLGTGFDHSAEFIPGLSEFDQGP